MIKHICLAFFILFSSFTFADSSDCATQEYTNSNGSSYNVTKASGEICKEDINWNSFSAFTNGETQETFEKGTVGQFIKVVEVLLIFIMVAVAAGGIYWLLKSADEGKDHKNKYRFLASLIFIGFFAFGGYYFFVYYSTRFVVYVSNYTNSSLQHNIEIAKLESQANKPVEYLNAIDFSSNFINAQFSAEKTMRDIERLVYAKLDTDCTDDYLLYCSNTDLSFKAYVERLNSCNLIMPKYNIESDWNQDHSVFDISYTKQNRSIDLSHTQKCSGDFHYNPEKFGYSGKVGTLEFGIIDTKNASYLTDDYINNIPTLVQIIDKASASQNGITSEKYSAYKAASGSKIAEIINSGRVAIYSELENESIIDSFANDMLNYAVGVLDSDKAFFEKYPTTAPIIFVQALGQRADAYLGKNRSGANEIEPLHADARAAAEAIASLECNLPKAGLTSKLSQVNQNSEVPYVSEQTKSVTDALLSIPTYCAKLGSNGFIATTAYTEQEKTIAFKLSQKMRYQLGGYYLNVQLAREKAKQMFNDATYSKNQASVWRKFGSASQLQQLLQNIEPSAAKALMSADTNARPHFISYVDMKRISNYTNYEIVYGKKASDEQKQSNSNDNIDISKYIDTGISSLTNNATKINNFQIEKESGFSVQAFFDLLERSLYSFSTYYLNRAVGINYAGNILDKSAECSVRICRDSDSSLAYAFAGSVESGITLVTVGISLKTIGFLGESFANGGEKILGSISAAPGIGLIAKASKLLTTALIGPISALIGYAGDLNLTIALVFFCAVVFCMFLAYLTFKLMLELFIDILIFPVYVSFEALKSAYRNDLNFLGALALFSLSIIARAALIGIFIPLTDSFYSTMAPFIQSLIFWISEYCKSLTGFLSHIVFNAVTIALTAMNVAISIFYSGKFATRILMSINELFKISLGSRDPDLAAIVGVMKTTQLSSQEWKKLHEKIKSPVRQAIRNSRRG